MKPFRNKNPYARCPNGTVHNFVEFRDDLVITYARCTNCGLILRKQLVGTHTIENYVVPSGWPHETKMS